MDVPSLLPLGYATPLPRRPRRPLSLIGIAFTIVLVAALFGAGTNAINGRISPTYFINVMGWQLVPNVWLATIEQGVLEGAVVGLIFSVIFTTTAGLFTRATCTFNTYLLWLGRIIVGIFGLWIVGGIGGMVLASAAPQFFQNTFFGVPGEHDQMLRYAWVGGSIWGEEPGGLLVVVVGLVLFGISWRRMLRRENEGAAN